MVDKTYVHLLAIPYEKTCQKLTSLFWEYHYQVFEKSVIFLNNVLKLLAIMGICLKSDIFVTEKLSQKSDEK